MLEIKPKQNNNDNNIYELWIDEICLGDVTTLGKPPKFTEIDITDFEIGKKIANHSFSQIFKYTESLILEYPQDCIDIYSKVFISQDEDRTNFTIVLSLVFDRNNWKQLWSVQEYIDEFERVVELFNSSYCCFRYSIDYDLIIELELQSSLETALIRSKLKQGRDTLLGLHDNIVKNLVSKLRSDSVVMYFDFPEEVKTPCEQYLLYFVQFLRDLGIASTAELQEDAGQVLFSVTPTNKSDALDMIYDALRIYLGLPSNHLSSPSVEYDIAVQRLSANIDNLNAQLRLAYAEIQYKNATIQTQQFLIENQRRELNSKNIFESSRITTTQEQNEDKEKLMTGIDITKYKGNGFEINLPELFRHLKRFFSDTK